MLKKDFDDNIKIWRSLFDLDEETIDALYADFVKTSRTSFNWKLGLTVKPWFVRFISWMERRKVLITHHMISSSDDDFVFVSCIDPVHRIKTLPLIAQDFKYSILFLPTVTRFGAFKSYNLYYKERSESVFFDLFSKEDIKEYSIFLRTNKRLINAVKCSNNYDTQLMRYQIRRFALFGINAKRVFRTVDRSKLWVFEHDKFFFIPVINEFRKKRIPTIQLQHGVFFDPRTAPFIPMYSDIVLCCSQREKSIYVESGKNPDDIYVVGAPLQGLCKDLIKSGEEKYDILVLLTVTSSEEWKDMQIKCLKYINEKLKGMKVLLRFRPRSAELDKHVLNPYIGFCEISEGNTLSEDISMSHRVINFSMDATFEAIRRNKPFITLVREEDLYGHYLDGICYKIEQLEEGIIDLLESAENHQHSIYLAKFGETNVDKVRDNFYRAINDIKSKEINI